MDAARTSSIEATKRPRDENFPVASLLLRRAHRSAVLAFYRFARAADDIADTPDLSPDEKVARLDAFERALVAGDESVPEAAALHALTRETGAGTAEARQLLSAFRQDAAKSRYADWRELLDYCRRSADPVGHFLLRLHGEDEAADAPSDALCTALQLLNHLQDIRTDYEKLDRIYLPVTWIAQVGDERTFFEPVVRAGRRAVLDAALDRIDALIDTARLLPRRVRDRRLRAQGVMTIALADRLSARLRAEDPVLARVEVGKADIARAFIHGCTARPRTDEAVTAAVVRRSRSSFRLGMRELGAERRRAIHAVYAFCRAADDIADGASPPAERLRLIEEWRGEIDRLESGPRTPIGRELAWATRAFDLPLAECHALLDGMETDCAEHVRLADDAALDLYARRVAGSVGALSIRIFGAPGAEDFALGLGRTLQLVNILRDVDEDAVRDRVYVPLTRLASLGLEDAPAPVLVNDARFAKACQDLAEEARRGFARADEALTRLDRAALRPAILMMEGYRRILDRLQARGWGSRAGRLRLTATDRLQLLSLAMRAA